MLRLYSDLKRILILTENLLFLAGRSLQRRAMRNGVLITVAMSSSIVKTNFAGAQPLTTDQLTALVIGAFASYPTGALLVRVAGFLTRDNIESAAAGYLHLTSHYKQARMRLHLHYLWHEVYGNDPVGVRAAASGSGDEYSVVAGDARDLTVDSTGNLVEADREHGDFDLFAERPFVGAADRDAHDSFVKSGLGALDAPLPMGLQSARIGFHLGPVEDWYEKGFFSYEDFPAKAMSRDPLIRRADRLITSRARHGVVRLLAPEAAPSFWYAFTVRKYCTLLGKSLANLNREAEKVGHPDYFDAQHFMWPSEELDEVVIREFEHGGSTLHRRLFAERRMLIGDVFSSDAQTARRHVMRMFARDYAWVFRLRLRFDGEWAAGRLHGDPNGELDAVSRAFSLSPLKRAKVDSLSKLACRNLELLDAALARRDNPVDPAVYQLLQVAAHIDYRGLRSNFLERAQAAALDDLLRVDGNFARDVGLLRELLHRIRVYHALVKMQILDYWSIVHRIGGLS